MRLKYIENQIWRSPTNDKPASWYLATNENKELFVIIASRSGKGDGTSSNNGRSELVQLIRRRLSDLRVKGLQIFKVNVPQRIITRQFPSRVDILNQNVSLALRFENMSERDVRCLFGEPTLAELHEREIKVRERRENSLNELASEQKEARKVYSTTTTARDQKAADAARKRDNYKCQFPGCDNTFKSSNGVPYVEVHHLTLVKDEGSDDLDNLVCLCGHHHAMIHYADAQTCARMTRELRELVRGKQ